MYEEVFHRIILENVPNIFRIKRSLEAFINDEIEKNNLPKIKSLRLARHFDDADVTHGQMILFNSDDYLKLAQCMDGKVFMGYTLKTRVYRVVNVCADSPVTISLKPKATKLLSLQESKASPVVKDKGQGIKRKLQP